MDILNQSSSLVLRAQNLFKDFEKGKEKLSIIRGVSLDVHEGECAAIMGSSGAGKSTLLHLLGGLDHPSRGEVLFGSSVRGAPLRNLWDLSDEDLSRFRNENLGFVFQFHYLLPEFSALENIMMPALIAGKPKDFAERRARDLIDYVGLRHRSSHRPAELSGGEQQRVAIARAVMLKPRLLLGDELTGNLDSENSQKVIDLILDLNRSFGIAVLLVTHDSQIAARMKRTFMMKDGKIVSS